MLSMEIPAFAVCIHVWQLWQYVELVSKELNHLAAILHVFAGGLIFMKQKKNIVFKKEKGNTLIIFIVKSLQKEQNSTNLLL